MGGSRMTVVRRTVYDGGVAEPRVPKTIRLSPAGVEAVQAIADRYGCDWSEAARRMLAYASVRMPQRWPVKEF